MALPCIDGGKHEKTVMADGNPLKMLAGYAQSIHRYVISTTGPYGVPVFIVITKFQPHFESKNSSVPSDTFQRRYEPLNSLYTWLCITNL
jgi:hypothetical protein